jgi:hypothetical protein
MLSLDVTFQTHCPPLQVRDHAPAPQGGYVHRRIDFADAAAIFAHAHIKDIPVHGVLNALA